MELGTELGLGTLLELGLELGAKLGLGTVMELGMGTELGLGSRMEARTGMGRRMAQAILCRLSPRGASSGSTETRLEL